MSAPPSPNFLPASSLAEVILRTPLGLEVLRRESAASWPRAGPHGPTDVSAHWTQYSFDNLPIRDALARTEHGIALLDSVCELLRAAAAAEEAYAAGLGAVASAAAPARLRGTGQGIGGTVDGGGARQADGLAGAVVSAVSSYAGGFFGTGAQTPAPSASASALFAIGNGPGSLGEALAALHRANAKQAAERAALGVHYKKLLATLSGLRASQRGSADLAISRATEAIRATQVRVARGWRQLARDSFDY